MDVSFGPGPLLAYRPPDDGSHFITDWKYWLETAGNFALLGAGAQFARIGRVFSTSFKFHPLPTITKLALPFTVTAANPGVIHLALDVAFYKGTGPAFEILKDQYQRLNDWLTGMDRESLMNALGEIDFQRVTNGGVNTEIRVIVEMPPAWLIDP